LCCVDGRGGNGGGKCVLKAPGGGGGKRLDIILFKIE
jgi:hypothetical protein